MPMVIIQSLCAMKTPSLPCLSGSSELFREQSSDLWQVSEHLPPFVDMDDYSDVFDHDVEQMHSLSLGSPVTSYVDPKDLFLPDYSEGPSMLFSSRGSSVIFEKLLERIEATPKGGLIVFHSLVLTNTKHPKSLGQALKRAILRGVKIKGTLAARIRSNEAMVEEFNKAGADFRLIEHEHRKQFLFADNLQDTSAPAEVWTGSCNGSNAGFFHNKEVMVIYKGREIFDRFFAEDQGLTCRAIAKQQPLVKQCIATPAAGKRKIINSSQHYLLGNVVQRLDNTEFGSLVRIASMTMSSPMIKKARACAQEGVKVQLILDQAGVNKKNFPLLEEAEKAGVEVLIDERETECGPGLQHIKMLLRSNPDGKVLTAVGTGNMTYNSSDNEVDIWLYDADPNLHHQAQKGLDETVVPHCTKLFDTLLARKRKKEEDAPGREVRRCLMFASPQK